MKKKPLPMFCLLLLLLSLNAAAGQGCVLLAGGEQSSPRKLTETYLEAFKNGDFEAMLELSGGWEGSAEELEFTRIFVDMIELKSYSVDKVETVSRTEAIVEVTLILSLLGQEKAQVNQLRVIKNEGKWYLAEGILD